MKSRLAILTVAALGLSAGPALAEDACPAAPPTHHLVLAQALPAGDREVRGVALSPDETQVLAGSNDASVRVWRVADGKLLMRSTPMDGPVWSVAFTRDGARVLAAGPMGPGEGKFSTQLWDVATGAKITSQPSGDVGLVTDSSTLLAKTLDGDFSQVALVDLVDARVALRWSSRSYENAWAYAHGSVGPLVMAANQDGSARFVDARGERYLEPRPSDWGDTAVALAADGKTGFYRRAVWDAETGRRLYDIPLRGKDSALQHPIFTPDGRGLLVAFSLPSGWDDVVVMDARTGAPITHICGASIVIEQAISGDSRRFATTTRTGAAVWEVATGALVARLDAPRFEVSDFAFSHDGRVLVTGSTDGVVRIWRLEAGDGPTPAIAPKRPRPG